jgi:hypothetical protein
MSAFLHSLPQGDGSILSGSVTVHGTGVHDYDVVSLREESRLTTSAYLTVSSGGNYVAVFYNGGTYLVSGDTGFTFRWKIWASGSGTVELRQDVDPAWAYSMPTPSLGNLVVSAGGSTLYHVAAGTISLSALLAGDGVRLGIIGVSGTVDIQTIQLECVPTSGTQGWWATDTDDSGYGDLEAAGTTRSSIGGGGYTSYVNRQDAWDTSFIEALGSGNPIADPSPSESPLTTLSILGLSWYRVNEILFEFPVPYRADVTLGIAKMWVHAPVVGSSPTPHGTEGVDYIRIPGYTMFDNWAYTRSSANHNNPPTSFANWVTPNAVYASDNGTYQHGDYADMNDAIGIWIVEEEYDSALPVSWVPSGDANIVITPATIGNSTESLVLPSSGQFAVYVLPMVLLDGGVGGDWEPVLPDPGADVGAYFQASVTLQSDPEAAFGAPLNYTITFDAFSVWDPYASPGGKLKVRLPDNTWRIVGDPAGSDTERLKLQTPDLTWWKEYRASDGAVPVHPLKLYTAGGWVVTGMMTPE